MAEANSNITDHKELFEKFFQKTITTEECFECENNLVGFFSLLLEIDREQKEKCDERNRN